MVAGYSDTISIPQWSQSDWDLFPNAKKIRIVKKASSNWGTVLDVETGDATPAEAPGWVLARRSVGYANPVVYCNGSTWILVIQEFKRQNVPEPLYWIAHYDGFADLSGYDGSVVAKQYANTPAYDLSVVRDYWPGVDDVPPSSALENDDMLLDHEYAPSSVRQYHHRTIETRSISQVAGDAWFAVSSGYQDMTDFHLYFIGVESPIVIPTITKDTRKWWSIPDGCAGISWDYLCSGPSGSNLVYGPR